MAKSTKALITPEVLKWAREKRIKLQIDYVAEKLKISPKRLEAWESGAEQPTIAQLKKIAQLYKTHISIFYLRKPPTDFKPLTDYRVLPKEIATDPDQVYRLNANIIEAYERREMLIELCHLLETPPPKIRLKIDDGIDWQYGAKKITEFLELDRAELRNMNTPYEALKFWKRMLEAKGILVCQTSVNTHLSIALETARGFCVAQQSIPVIVVNTKDSPHGRIFTLIHELVHIALGRSAIQNTGFEVRPPAELDPVEIFCNKVAAEVLVPENELLKIIKLENLETELPNISKRFQVSPEVIMRRLLSLEKITPQKYQAYRNRLLEKYKTLEKKPGGAAPYDKKLLNTAGEYFARTAFTAYYEDKITRAELASMLSNSNTKHLKKIENTLFV